MSARRTRMARAAELAAEDEERAKARWAAANQLIRRADLQRETVLHRASELAEHTMSTGLRAMLVSAGARHLLSMADTRAELQVGLEAARVELERAMVRTRSLERVVVRQEAAERSHQQRIGAADLQDLVAIRSARGKRSES